MFTGIVQATATIAALEDRSGLRTFTLEFPPGFCQDLAVGASVSTDGVCLTVTEILSPTQAAFDVMLQSLNVTTLGSYQQGDRVNVERAAKDGAEIGGHPLSGHIDFTGTLMERRAFDIFDQRDFIDEDAAADIANDARHRRGAGEAFLLGEEFERPIAPTSGRNLEHTGFRAVRVEDRADVQ